jgi:hypothetical protein
MKTRTNMSMPQFIDFTVGCASDGNLLHVISKSLSAIALHWTPTYTEKTAAMS